MISANVMLTLFTLTLLPLTTVQAYQTGDPIGLLFRTPSGTRDALRSQMPSFGVDTSTLIDLSSIADKDDPSRDVTRQKLSVALTFGTGAESKAMPWVDARMLQKLQVSFVYVRGGDIRSISQSPTFGTLSGSSDRQFAIEYVWIEEADVDLDSGLLVMFVSVLIATLILSVSACGALGQSTDNGERKGYMAGEDAGYASDATYGSYDTGTVSHTAAAGSWAGGSGEVYGAHQQVPTRRR